MLAGSVGNKVRCVVAENNYDTDVTSAVATVCHCATSDRHRNHGVLDGTILVTHKMQFVTSQLARQLAQQ